MSSWFDSSALSGRLSQIASKAQSLAQDVIAQTPDRLTPSLDKRDVAYSKKHEDSYRIPSSNDGFVSNFEGSEDQHLLELEETNHRLNMEIRQLHSNYQKQLADKAQQLQLLEERLSQSQTASPLLSHIRAPGEESDRTAELQAKLQKAVSYIKRLNEENSSLKTLQRALETEKEALVKETQELRNSQPVSDLHPGQADLQIKQLEKDCLHFRETAQRLEAALTEKIETELQLEESVRILKLQLGDAQQIAERLQTLERESETVRTEAETKVKASERRVSELESDLKSWREKHDALSSSLIDLESNLPQNRAADLESDLKELNAECDRLRKEKQALRDDHEALNETFRALDQSSTGLREQLDQLQQQHAHLEQQQQQEAQKSDELAQKSEALAQRIAELEQENGDLGAELRDYKDREIHFLHQIDSLKTGHALSSNEMLHMEEGDGPSPPSSEDVAQLQATIESLTLQTTADKEQASRQIAQLETQIAKLEEQLSLTQKENELLFQQEAEVHALLASKDQLLEQHQQHDLDRENHHRDLEQIQSGQVQSLQSQLDAVTGELEALRSTLSTREAAVAEIERHLRTEKEALAQHLRDQADQHQAQLNALESEYDNAKRAQLEAIDTLRTQLAEQGAASASIKSALETELQTLAASHLDRVSQIEAELGRYRESTVSLEQAQQSGTESQLQTIQQIEAILSSVLTGAQLDAILQDTSLSAWTLAAADTTSAHAGLVETLSRTENQLRKLDETIQQLRGECAQSKERADALQHELETALADQQYKVAAARESYQESVRQLEADKQQLKDRQQQLEDEKQQLEGEKQLIASEKRQLEGEKQQLKDENQRLANDHTVLVEKVRNVLAPKLQSEMEAAQVLRLQIANITAERDDAFSKLQRIQTEQSELLNSSSHHDVVVASLRQELESSHEHLDKTSRELDRLRQHLVESEEFVLQEAVKSESVINEYQTRIRDLEESLKQWQETAELEASRVKELEASLAELKDLLRTKSSDLELLARENAQYQLAVRNLQGVLEEFQSTRDAEVKFALEGMQHQLDTARRSLEEFQSRALSAESRLAKVDVDSPSLAKLQSELNEKNLALGKLRHDVIQLQAHLAEALRRLKDLTANEDNVDRKLITNLFISFVLTNRGDKNRYEILQLIAAILKFSEDEKCKVGLIRRPGWTLTTPTQSSSADTSFTDMWVSFLLKESSGDNLVAEMGAVSPTKPEAPPMPMPSPSLSHQTVMLESGPGGPTRKPSGVFRASFDFLRGAIGGATTPVPASPVPRPLGLDIREETPTNGAREF
ncbi:uncharacterized protein BJ171DRAFT_513162 [Polychytrium aggregatum]|uniref:uncharacterized protein n=1 Tax=Polychytrium aggregatum TaxID=110093 RepID=UPI0022FE02D9|nr:uncharacterized protein BJ171DRAFT_513162 [Polychytrium aggregatum]KAI9202773.1 hypothetical protein BJ171DRAFT_513162 [Polychytrium aggregatum]